MKRGSWGLWDAKPLQAAGQLVGSLRNLSCMQLFVLRGISTISCHLDFLWGKSTSPQTYSHSSQVQKSGIKRWGSAWDANVPSPGPPELWLLIVVVVTELQLPRPQTWPARQTEHAGRGEGRHIQRLYAVVAAADDLHWRHDHHNQPTSGTMICRRVVPWTS